MRISDWSSDVCSSDLGVRAGFFRGLDVVDRDAGVVRARAREHEHPAPRLIGAGAHDAKVFVLRHRRRLAGGAARHQRRRSFGDLPRSEEHTSELHSLMHISYAVFCWKKKKIKL